IAVEFNFVDPILAAWRARYCLAELGPNKARHRRTLRGRALLSDGLQSHQATRYFAFPVGVPDGARIRGLAAPDHEWFRTAAFASGDLIHCAARGNRLVVSKCSIAIAFALITVAMLDE